MLPRMFPKPRRPGGVIHWRVSIPETGGRLEVSLRTRDPEEAARRASRLAPALPIRSGQAQAWVEAMDKTAARGRKTQAELDATARALSLEPLDDPAFRDALCAEAEARGWYGPPDADETIEHFWAMRAGMDAMTEAYHDACRRKGIDPATREPVAKAAVAFKDLANRYIRRRTEGYACLRKVESLDDGAAKAFVQGQSGNFLGSASLFVDFIGGDEVTEQLCADFVSLLARIPGSHGKSSKDKRGIRQIVQDADNQELIEAETIRAKLTAAKAKPGMIEDAVASKRIPRLKTATIVRHARAIAAILDWGVALGELPSNPMRLCVPSAKEITSRSRREVSGKREGWTVDEFERLFSTPLFVDGPKDLDDELFWAPLIAAHSGARSEEILQLRGTDVQNGWIHFRITDAPTQSLKSNSAVRRVPIHSNLVALGLVELARRAGGGRLFPGATRSKARGKLSENFAKTFGYYRRKHLGEPWNLPDKDFHSLRGGASTTMIHGLSTVQSIVGHESEQTTIDHYYSGDSDAMLRAAIEKIAIDVSGVKRVFG